ncbi:MAG: hypothetical protein ACRC0X_02125 [Brevinema sp.]
MIKTLIVVRSETGIPLYTHPIPVPKYQNRFLHTLTKGAAYNLSDPKEKEEFLMLKAKLEKKITGGLVQILGE